jgi:flagellar biosynthetic protein FlhB
MAEENGDKKHDPTQRRLEQSREQGQVAKSQDLAAAIILLLAILLLMTFGKQIVAELYEYAHEMLVDPMLLVPDNHGNGNLEQSVHALFRGTVFKFLKPLSIFFLLLLLTAVAANVAQIGFLWLPNKLFDIKRIDPIKGFGRIFSMQSVVRLLMGILKIVICAVVAWYAVEGSINQILILSESDTNEIASFLVWIILMIALKVAVALVIIALIDLMYQRQKHMRDLRMTDQEMRDEIKNSEGDPQLRWKRKQMHREMAMQMQTQGTKDADVVVANPTHYSVAIKFDPHTMDIPVVVAKGEDYWALQIRKIAAEHGIPVIERKTLARLLYEKIEVGQSVYTIPEHWQTLVEVLIEAYKLTGRDPNVLSRPTRRRTASA